MKSAWTFSRIPQAKTNPENSALTTDAQDKFSGNLRDAHPD